VAHARAPRMLHPPPVRRRHHCVYWYLAKDRLQLAGSWQPGPAIDPRFRNDSPTGCTGAGQRSRRFRRGRLRRLTERKGRIPPPLGQVVGILHNLNDLGDRRFSINPAEVDLSLQRRPEGLG
jgi:hypothetical protein